MKEMKYKGFTAQIMEAIKLTGAGTHGLPPGTPLDVYHSDEFKVYPENWMKGPGVFVCPVKSDRGLWFNWRNNSEVNTAIIPTVKGCNPITGMQTSGFHLEKYENKCPKHNCDFQGDLYCPECGYKWPDRNYVSMSPLWWDGFRAEDGAVRQFFFTEDELKDVASAMIGKENTVSAFGFAFYSPKVPRQDLTRGRVVIGDASPAWLYNVQTCSSAAYPMTTNNNFYNALLDTQYLTTPSNNNCSSAKDGLNICDSGVVKSLEKKSKWDSVKRKRGLTKCAEPRIGQSVNCFMSAAEDLGIDIARERSCYIERPVKEVSVGAGAKINQSLPRDSYALDSWKDTPDATMTIYFVFQEKFEELKAGGMIDLSGSTEGMLTGVPVGA